MKKMKRLLCLLLVILIVFSLCACGGHAPGYGNTSKCTICGKKATHKTSNYGYCDTHWKKATGQ